MSFQQYGFAPKEEESHIVRNLLIFIGVVLALTTIGLLIYYLWVKPQQEKDAAGSQKSNQQQPQIDYQDANKVALANVIVANPWLNGTTLTFSNPITFTQGSGAAGGNVVATVKGPFANANAAYLINRNTIVGELQKQNVSLGLPSTVNASATLSTSGDLLITFSKATQTQSVIPPPVIVTPPATTAPEPTQETPPGNFITYGTPITLQNQFESKQKLAICGIAATNSEADNCQLAPFIGYNVTLRTDASVSDQSFSFYDTNFVSDPISKFRLRYGDTVTIKQNSNGQWLQMCGGVIDFATGDVISPSGAGCGFGVVTHFQTNVRCRWRIVPSTEHKEGTEVREGEITQIENVYAAAFNGLGNSFGTLLSAC